MEESFEAILNKLKMSKISTNGNFSINLNGLPNPFFKNSKLRFQDIFESYVQAERDNSTIYGTISKIRKNNTESSKRSLAEDTEDWSEETEYALNLEFEIINYASTTTDEL